MCIVLVPLAHVMIYDLSSSMADHTVNKGEAIQFEACRNGKGKVYINSEDKNLHMLGCLTVQSKEELQRTLVPNERRKICSDKKACRTIIKFLKEITDANTIQKVTATSTRELVSQDATGIVFPVNYTARHAVLNEPCREAVVQIEAGRELTKLVAKDYAT